MSSRTTMFEGLLEAVPDALVGVDEAGVIRYVNGRTESMFGYDRDDLVGAPLETLVPDSLRQVQEVHREGDDAAPSAQPMGSDLKLSGLRRGGTQFPVDIALSAIDSGNGIAVIVAVHDMTPYRRAEAERRRLDRLLAIVEYSDDAIIDTTLDGTVTSWNPAAEVTFGYSSGEIIGESVQRLSLQDQTGQARDLLARITRGEQIDHFESIRVRKDRTPIPVSLSVSPIRGDDGSIVGASTIARDVTQARAAFEAARSMMEASLDSLVSISPEGKITDANEATVQLTGVPRDKLIGTSFSDYFTDPAKANEVYQRVFTQEMAADYQLTLRRHNGGQTLTEVLYNASVHRGPSGEVVGVFAAARDVTKQSHAFEAARSMMEASLDALVAISPEGKITDANEATVKLTGSSREQLIGTSFSQYFTDPARAEEIYQRVLAGGRAVDYPLTLSHHNGREVLTEVRYNASVYRDGDGNVLGVFAAARDVTEQIQDQRRVAEQQATALERLAELERFQRLAVGRELKMIELKEEIERLRKFRPTDPREPGDQH